MGCSLFERGVADIIQGGGFRVQNSVFGIEVTSQDLEFWSGVVGCGVGGLRFWGVEIVWGAGLRIWGSWGLLGVWE